MKSLLVIELKWTKFEWKKKRRKEIIYVLWHSHVVEVWSVSTSTFLCHYSIWREDGSTCPSCLTLPIETPGTCFLRAGAWPLGGQSVRKNSDRVWNRTSNLLICRQMQWPVYHQAPNIRIKFHLDIVQEHYGSKNYVICTGYRQDSYIQWFQILGSLPSIGHVGCETPVKCHIAVP